VSRNKAIQLVRGRAALITAWHRWGSVAVYVHGRLIATCRYPAAPPPAPDPADS